jgi:hypothetical protein
MSQEDADSGLPASHDAGPGALTWVTVDGILTTNDVVAAYDGNVQLSDEAIYGIAEHFNGSNMPFTAHHDPLQRIPTRNVQAWVEGDPGGRLVVRFSAEVPEREWQNLGPAHQMSYAATAAIGPDIASTDAQHVIEFAADAAWFWAEDIEAAAANIQFDEDSGGGETPLILVVAKEFFQFSHVPEPRIIIETSLLLWQALGPNLVASAIWDGLKILLTRRRVRQDRETAPTTSVEFRVRAPQGGSVDAVIRTGSSDVAELAVGRLADVVEKLMARPSEESSVHLWTQADSQDGEGGTWRAT